MIDAIFRVMMAVGLSVQGPAQPNPTPVVTDYTEQVALIISELYTPEEMRAAGDFTINWMDESLESAAFVPYVPSNYPQCLNAQRCILFRYSWWSASGWDDQPSANRVLVAHEFAHVLSMQRKLSDKNYEQAVYRINEECLADAVAEIVLARGGFRPPVTEDYNVAYHCEEYWIERFGESRAQEASDLAFSLLEWSFNRFDGPEIYDPAVAGQPATRVGVIEE